MSGFPYKNPEPRETPLETRSGFGAMGHPIPDYRRQAAYEHCRDIGLDQERSWEVVNGMAEQLERDKPYEAMQAASGRIDLTGAYRIMAVLLTTEPRIESGPWEQKK